MTTKTDNQESYGEFKGNTSAKLETIFYEIKQLRQEVDELKSFRWQAIGFGAAAGFLVTILKDFLVFKR